ncbi:hypothetical protein BDZ94DRAFT_1319050 [Collybia nuda]|uniref:F-box domain-containing protein n=1 Tax=Collybia nuda TaxID=64659 RepID=A0A9P5YFG6_9AGAR|nr:hypothetical protein BDZ94DRAFT_1319050 [Collybia nuda]
MHVALQIHEILVLIFKEADRHTLLAATSCCRVFSAAALDVLWRVIQGFSPLLRIHPAFQTYPSPRLHHHWQILQGVISDEAWARFDDYARRVRLFYNRYPGDDPESIHPSVYLYLARRVQFIFPHLTQINLNLEYLDDETGISTLLCLPPSLRRLELSYYSPEYFSDGKYIVGAILDQIPNTAPDIVDLRIDLHLPDDYLDKIIRMKQLRTLALSEMTIISGYLWLHQFPTLTNLTNLTLSVINIPGQDPSFPLDWRDLTCLRNLTMHGLLENFAYILSALPADQLHALKLTMDGRRTLAKDSWSQKLWQELHTCLNLISKHYSLHEIKLDLQTLELHDNITRDEMIFPPFLPIIQPLLSLRLLRTAIFRAFPPIDLSNDNIFTCAESWPDIETLDFPFTLRTTISLDTVKPLLSKCHKLIHLGIALDRLDFSIGLEHRPWSTILATLRIHISTVSDPHDAAAYLLQLFPVLRKVQSFTYDRDVNSAVMCANMGNAMKALRGETSEPEWPLFLCFQQSSTID